MASREEVQKLFIRYVDRIEAFIFGLNPDSAASKDLLNDTFLVVTENHAEFRSGTDFLAWARKIALNKVMQFRERRRRLPHLLDPEVLEQLEADQDAVDDGWELHRKALAECVKKLSPRLRELIGLRYFAETLPPRLIAERMGWTPAAVRVGLCRARASLYGCTERSVNGGKA